MVLPVFSDFSSEDDVLSVMNAPNFDSKRRRGVVMLILFLLKSLGSFHFIYFFFFNAKVSITTLQLRNVEAFVQLNDDDVIVSATIDDATPHELGNIHLDKFQERFTGGTLLFLCNHKLTCHAFEITTLYCVEVNCNAILVCLLCFYRRTTK